jgi:hypothetical protein
MSWDIRQFGPLKVTQYFGGTCILYLQDRFETFITIRYNKQSHSPESHNLEQFFLGLNILK